MEARGFIKNIEKIRNTIEEAGGVLKGQYEFSDVVFLPPGDVDLNKEYIKLRLISKNSRKTKDVILIYKINKWEWDNKKDSTLLRKEFDKPQEALDYVKKHLKDNLKEGFEFSREGWEYQLGKIKIFVEDIEDFYPMVEVEADTEEQLTNVLSALESEKVNDCLPELIRKKLTKEL